MSASQSNSSLTIEQAQAKLRDDFQQDFPADYFLRNPPSKESQLFELGLCFAGSVSAGAYQAGVADFLIEALDCWTQAKSESQPTTPPHHVRLSALSGASGGGMTALLLATALNRKLVPARASRPNPPYTTEPPTVDQNPLYGTWVKGIDVVELLKLDDLSANGSVVQSLFNSRRIAELAQGAFSSTGSPLSRDYVGNPLHLGATIGNLNGFAYQFGLRSTSQYGYQARVHEDVVRFAIWQGSGSAPSPGVLPALPNEQIVDLSQRPTDQNMDLWAAPWRLAAQTAMATGAFPVGLLPRDVVRYWQQCDPRILPLSQGVAPRVAILPVCLGEASRPEEYSCVNVDGGTFNNEPFEVARTYLAGLLGENSRIGSQAVRAVIMVDPLVQPPKDDFERSLPSDTVFRYISGLVFRAFVNQGRTHLREWTLAMADDIYSRYLLAPTKGQASGEDAICGGTLGAFSGFLCEAYREHDFRLGRRNCQRFLREHFSLPEDNPVFARWTEDMKRRFACSEGDDDTGLRFLPIIPLVGEVAAEEPEPAWPSHDEFGRVRDSVYEHLKGRVDAIYDTLTRELPWYAKVYLGLGWFFVKPVLLEQVHKTIEDALKKKNLWS